MVLSVKKEKSVPLHRRKRHGHHHKRTKQYEKHYWPYLPLLSFVGLGFLLNILWNPLSHALISHQVLGYATNTSLVGLLDETNTRRTGNGLTELQLNSQLNQAAQAKAEDMANRNYWSHTTPDGQEPWWFINKAGYPYLTVGENLAYGFDSSSTTIAGWMNSPAHRANLLNVDFYDVGFGIAHSTDYVSNGPQTIIVAMYGKTPASSAVTPIPVNQGGSQLQSQAATTSPASQPTAAAAPQATPQAPAVAGFPTRQDTLTTPTPSKTIATEPQPVSRLQTIASTIPAGSVASLILIAGASAALLIFRHARAWHRKLAKGEHFVLTHPSLDIAFILVLVIGALLTRTAGYIN